MRFIIVLGALAITACAKTQPINTSSNPGVPGAYELALIECRKIEASTAGKMLPAVDCYSRADVDAHRGSDPRYLTVAIETRVAALRVAESHDSGALSDVQARAQMDLIMDQERTQKSLLAAQDQMKQSIDEESDRARRMALLRTGLEIMKGPPTVTCTTFGNTTNCHGN